MHKIAAKQLALKLAGRLKHRLGDLWNPVAEDTIHWQPSDDEEPHAHVRGPRRILFFHLASILNINECHLEFLDCSETERLSYVNSLSSVVACEACELGENSAFSREDLSSLFVLFHKQMVRILK